MTKSDALMKIDWMFRSKEHENLPFQEKMEHVKNIVEKLYNSAFDNGQICGLRKAKEQLDFLSNEIKP